LTVSADTYQWATADDARTLNPAWASNWVFLLAGRARVAALLFGLLLRRIQFYGEPKPIFSDQEPGVYIFRFAGVTSPIQAFSGDHAVLIGGHTHLKIN
jgi:hypothetical protein